MDLEFTKMHGLGNDFIVLNGLDKSIRLTGDQIRFLSDRHFGVGCDQLLLIEPARDGRSDVRYRIFNADGNEVQQCGNGARCIAEFLYREGIIRKDTVNAETDEGVIRIYRREDGMYTVDMGVPGFEPAKIPMRAGERADSYELRLDDISVEVYALSMGNPHAVLPVEDVDEAPVETLGPRIQQHPDFPEGVNAGFMQIIDREHIRLRVYERGAGETLACGSGACAAVVAGRMAGRLDKEVVVGLKGGTLVISWQGEGETVRMSGPATMVYKGRISI
ncbi:MAG: diaminopimelate epimerase [Gammaproteobacteria bacterium]